MKNKQLVRMQLAGQAGYEARPQGGPRPQPPAPRGRVELTMAQADRLFASGKATGPKLGLTTPDAVFAALTNVSTPDSTSGNIAVTSPPQWLGESLLKARYRRTISSVVEHDDLSSFQVQGYEWEDDPTGGTHDMAGSPIATGPLDMNAWGPVRAYSWASGNSVDRAPFDFGVQGSFLSSYSAAGYSVYSAWVDQRTFDQILPNLAAIPASASHGALSPAWSAIVDGIAAVLPNANPTFAIVSVAEATALLKDIDTDVLDLVSNMVGTDFDIRVDVSGRITSGQTLVGADIGTTLYELPGGGLRAAQAPETAAGNIDVGLFGYAYPKFHGPLYYALVNQGS